MLVLEYYFWVECNVCKTQYKNWVGSTPCCGSVAYIIVGEEISFSKEDDSVHSIKLFSITEKAKPVHKDE